MQSKGNTLSTHIAYHVRFGLVSLVFAAYTLSAAPAPKQLDYIDLVDRLVRLDQLAVLPAPGETTKQWSSWNRKSRYDERTNRYLDWDYNADGRDIIRREGDWEVLAEMDGPGCIWRIWSAFPGKGRIKIILDGAAEAAVDLPFIGLFNGENKPFDYPSLNTKPNKPARKRGVATFACARRHPWIDSHELAELSSASVG